MYNRPVFSCMVILIFALYSSSVSADKMADISGTRHNLSVSGPGETKSTTNTEICVFCHTPHAATTSPAAPLWNRQLSTQTYTSYTSSSLDAETIAGQLSQPAGSSKLCLSCHDGTLALGTVNVLGGVQNAAINMNGTGAAGTMPPGLGEQTGFTRNLGTNLTNDHPISLTYDTSLAQADGEMFDPATAAHINVGIPGMRPAVPLEATGTGNSPQVQCGTCHDPHLRDTDITVNAKFLRLNRFQVSAPIGGQFNQATDIVCLGCHDKAGWSTSAHADPVVADESYNGAGAELRQFDANLPVWRASCLNCHDTHTVHGARRLLREGTDSLGTPKTGGNSAIEETCYQCHSSNPVISNLNNSVPDIKTDFTLPRHMPVTSLDQASGSEIHDVTDSDLSEPAQLLGKGNMVNRHAECTDCHNPHRVMRNRLFNGVGDSSRGAHQHQAGVPHSNIASGVLRGGWGVEPIYSNSAFLSLPLGYQVKKGDAGTGASTDVNSAHVTREYQVCLKCHSDFSYDDNGVYPVGTRPNPGDSGGGTPAGTNNLQQFTNQAMEFQAPLGDRGEPGGNHRSWHPVIEATERSSAVRGNMSAGAFVAPWNSAVGNQTMYCSDCHGSSTAANTVVPSGNRAWGPHGSENNFILKGQWNSATGNGARDAPGATDPNNGLCFKCHDYRSYADRNGNGNNSGFGGSKDQNLHAFHTDRIGRIRCSWCHVAVPHGWKNKALLVNLNDVGEEAGVTPPQEIPVTSSAQVYNQGPYYLNAKLKVRTFATSGNWEDINCGSSSGQSGTGRDWMNNVCSNPP